MPIRRAAFRPFLSHILLSSEPLDSWTISQENSLSSEVEVTRLNTLLSLVVSFKYR